jgi:hypothetical protein
MMKPAECFRRILLFQEAEYIPRTEAGPMSADVEQEWRQQGSALGERLPEGVSFGEYFRFVYPIRVYGRFGKSKFEPIPGMPDQGILEQDERRMVTRDCWGREIEWFAPGVMSEGAHRILRNGIRDRDDWNKIKDHFRADEPWRYPGSLDTRRPPVYSLFLLEPPKLYQGEPESYEMLEATIAAGDELIQVFGPSMIGELKEIMGYENLCIAMYEDRALLEEIIWTRTELAMHVLDVVMDRAKFPILHFWEDIAYNGGPLISPKLFRELAVPAYRELSKLFRAKGGQIVSVDSDGDIRSLIPGWLEAGVTHFFPLEVKAGMDVVALRREYGKSMTMRGGIDKHVLFQGQDAIRRELERVAPVAREGGYIPMIDHSIPPGVPFEDYCAYVRLKSEILGVPGG